MTKRIILFGGVFEEPIEALIEEESNCVYVPYEASESLIEKLEHDFGTYGDDRPIILNMKYERLAETNLYFPKGKGYANR